MDWVNLHLLVNHFPIILGVAGAFAAVAALLSRNEGIWRYAFVTVLLAGLTAPAAYITGLEAEEVVEHEWYIVEDELEEHEELGLYALIALLAAGASAAVALWKPGRATKGVFAVLTLVAVGVTAYTALEGGEIVHESPAFEQRPPAAPAGGEASGGGRAPRD